MKKVTAMLTAIVLAGLLTACGGTFDAAGYTQALMDNSYKNDSTAFVEMKIGTAEEAAQLYEEGLDAEIDALVGTSDLTAEQAEEFRGLFQDILASVKYTVGEAAEQDDGSFEVTITYEQMNLFEPVVTAYFTKIMELSAEWMQTGEAPSDEEITVLVMDLLKEELATALANVTYDEPATTTVRIELQDNTYMPNEEDLTALEMALFDTEAIANMALE